MDQSGAMSRVTRPCPECGATMPVDTRGITWCLDCEWNLDPDGSLAPRSRRAAKRNEAQAERLLRRGSRGRVDLGATVALALGVAALLLAPVCVVGGVAMAVGGRGSPLLIGLGVILAVVGVAVRPRFPRLDDRDVDVDAGQAPEFWGLVREVAAAVGTKPPKQVVLALEPNAGVGHVGGLSRTVMWLGTPLWAIVDRQERVGLLAHELAHVANGDPRRGRLVGLGTQTLVRWWVLLVPPANSDGGLASLGGPVLLAGLRGIVRLWLAAMARLEVGGIQRAELRSDRAAAQVAGWAGYTQMLDRLRYVPRLGHAIHQATARRDGVDFYASLAGNLQTLPPQEEERLRRLATKEPYDRGRAHPPARLRLRAVEDLQAEAGLVVPDAARWARIDAELAPVMATVAQQARDRHDATTDRHAGRHPARLRPLADSRP